ncbi:nephrin-like [Palaemon carinicauda]|uniref:nephrin-like n=1 Tax=Palaemon carinicauda TaxID=392227 RepID=UPI0035B68DB8
MSLCQERNMRVLLTCIAAFALSRDIRVNGAVVSKVETLVDRTVALPCKATQHPVGDTPNLLLFYRQSSNIPFFSYDARNGYFWREGSSKTRDAFYEDRVFLNITRPANVHLNLKRVSIEDAGDFTCRVDFVSSPSLTSIVKLKVFANPTVGPIVRVGTGPGGTIVSGTEVGPFFEGEMVNLSCTVTGGIPPPLVRWWQDTKLLDNDSYVVNKSGPPLTVNDISFGPITRESVSQPFTCRSENNPLSSPIDRTVQIKIHMAPQKVTLPASATVRAGFEERLECRAEGAYPEANITYYLNGKPLDFISKETRQIGTQTVSWVSFMVTPKINKATFTCIGSSPTLPDPPVSTNITLNVTHAPEVHLELGSSLNSDLIRQGDDVYFECQAEANPPVQKITWYKRETERENLVKHNKASGVIVGGNNLVLQGVQQRDAGLYTCRATNSVATTSSNPLSLKIQYVPMCTQGRVTITAVEGEVVSLHCEVDAYPSNVTFHWLFNNTVDSTRFRSNEYTVSGLESTLRYVAYSARDYGTVFCWASNMVGRQEDPCAFTLQPAGAPDSVHDCVIANQSAGSLLITCKPGADGGLTQTFRAAVYSTGVSQPVRVLEGMSPVFTVEGLAPGKDYIVTLTAINRRGSSPPVSLEAFTLKVAENRMISGVSSTQAEPKDSPTGAVSPLLGVFLGIVGAFLLLATAVVFLTRKHCSGDSASTPDLVAGQELETKQNNQDLGGPSGEGMTRGHDSVDTPDLTESDPFLMTSECSSRTVSTPTSAGGGVFTIPTHIPPPPQYCSSSCNDLSPTQHVVHHTPPGQSSQQFSVTPAQHIIQQDQTVSHMSLQRSSPQQYGLRRSASVERCGTRAVITQPCVGSSSSPTHWPLQHGTHVKFSIHQTPHSKLGIIYSTSTDDNIHQQHHHQQISLIGSKDGTTPGSSTSIDHYIQPLSGVESSCGDPIVGLPCSSSKDISRSSSNIAGTHHSGAPHLTIGLAPQHLGTTSGSGAMQPQISFVPEQGPGQSTDPPVTHSSPKGRGKHVTWTGGPTHGEESAV